MYAGTDTTNLEGCASTLMKKWSSFLTEYSERAIAIIAGTAIIEILVFVFFFVETIISLTIFLI